MNLNGGTDDDITSSMHIVSIEPTFQTC